MQPDELPTAEELLAGLRALDEQLQKKVAIMPRDVQQRYERELAPRLLEIEKLVVQRSPIARNAAEDAMQRFREFFITAV